MPLKTVLLSFLFLPAIVQGQYSIDDRALAEAAFIRDAGAAVFDNYLSSDNPEQVKAALLALANIGDTTRHAAVAALDESRFSREIAFVFANSEASTTSLNYLRNKLNSASGSAAAEIFAALGRIGDLNDLEAILNQPINNDLNRIEGIALAVANFAFRGIRSSNSEKSLLSLMENEDIDGETGSLLAFALYRVKPTAEDGERIKNLLLNVLEDDVTPEEENFAKYLLQNLRFLKIAPFSAEETVNIMNSLDFSQQTEIISLLSNREYASEDELSPVLQLTQNDNGNVALVATTLLRNQNAKKVVTQQSMHKLLQSLESAPSGSLLAEELIKTVFYLFSGGVSEKSMDEAGGNSTANQDLISKTDICKKYSNKLSPASKAAIIAAEPEIFGNPFDSLVVLYNSGQEPLKFAVATALEQLKKTFTQNRNEGSSKTQGKENNFKLQIEKINSFALRGLSSGLPSVVSVFSEVFDSTFIAANRAQLKDVILRAVNEDLHNPNFYEAHQSIVTLAEKIDKDFGDEIKSLFLNSAVNSIKALSGEKVERQLLPNFEEIWYNAFRYQFAEIQTEFGTIRLELLPQYAPVSVGNFITLVQTSFYRNILFHRVVPGFVIQAGDPSGTGWGGPGYDIISELSPLDFHTGAFGMASAGKDTEGSQFFIMTGSYPHLNSRYTLFGYVTSGIDSAVKVTQGSKIIKISLF
ncbi:MAG: peptidylprolyl isomerase [Ignavibacteriales bacterium]|nr:hypothetical protein [Ignavibacteriaceae bacterium]MBZ0197590.1 peptidylprolyl isomerase [Ignavibacteriaceae bacterium]MCZ2141979.1 peptidylprolyl isomerase [Ignavibacteriales bacterium]WKZ73752.1 MAG: peptidylprolyl isomerase [Ignavibacteriaceae bacterium]